MFVSNLTQTTELYNIFSEMGILCTENRRIREVRDQVGTRSVSIAKLSYDDIERVGYFYPHFMLDRQDKDKLELWVGNEYINPAEVTWIETEVHLYGIMPRTYDVEKDVVTVIKNDHIFQRYSSVAEVEGDYNHIQSVDISKPPFNTLDHPDKCAFYIADGRIGIPEVHMLDSTHWEFWCPYTKSVDLYLCSNLAGTYQVMGNQGTLIDNPYNTKRYPHIVVDHDPVYPIDAKFYPCIKVDKDCIVRVYTDIAEYAPYPEISRLICYPEFMMYPDPYNCSDEYLNTLPDVNDVIVSTDNEEEILDKFSRIAAYCYRAYEKFPFFCNEQSDFLICDNSKFRNPTFHIATVHYLNGTAVRAIVTSVPFEGHRDILFYNGMVFSDYTVANIRSIGENDYVESADYGQPLYIIPVDKEHEDQYDLDKFTLIKFNAAEDTVIENIGDYVNSKNIVDLHMKLNRFYRNMIILRGTVLDQYEGDAVRVGTVEPTMKDEHLWFELLVNTVPEMFETNPEGIILDAGIDPDAVPSTVKAGAYALDLPDDNGPQSYTSLLLTYFTLAKANKEYLNLQIGPGVQDPRIGTFTEMSHGPLPENPDLNAVAIENLNLPEREGIEKYESGIGPPPDTFHSPGEIYVEKFKGTGLEDLLDGVGIIPADTFALDTISYMDDETGNVITGDEIAGYTIEQKKQIILRYITEGTDEEKEAIKILWENYLDTMDEETLNVAVYKVLLIDHIYSIAANEPANTDDDLDSPEYRYIVKEEAPEDADIGMYWVKLPEDSEPLAIQEAKMNNLKYIMSLKEPDLEEVGAVWIDIPAVTLQDYIGDIICTPLLENGYSLPEGFLISIGNGDSRATATFDFGAHGDPNSYEPEVFHEVNDQSLHTIHAGESFDESQPEDGAIWYEFLDEVSDQICYSDQQTMVMAINERLMMLQFDDTEFTAFMFDDIVLNFRGKLGLRYNSILADLINSKVIDLKNTNIFYKRLVTGDDIFYPELMRLYTGHPHVISTANIDTTDYSITYSTNIGRYHIDYNDSEVSNREREAIWRQVIDYTRRDIAFLGDRMMLFVNGRYIPRSGYTEIAPGKIQLHDFPEIIACVDFFYSKKDIYLIRAKKLAIRFWNVPDESVSIQRPDKNYDKMVPMHVCDQTYRGFYDVLLNEYILNGRLVRELRYLEEHPEETEWYVADLVRKFNAISDNGLRGMSAANSRIIIPAFGDESAVYTIQE